MSARKTRTISVKVGEKSHPESVSMKFTGPGKNPGGQKYAGILAGANVSKTEMLLSLDKVWNRIKEAAPEGSLFRFDLTVEEEPVQPSGEEKLSLADLKKILKECSDAQLEDLAEEIVDILEWRECSETPH